MRRPFAIVTNGSGVESLLGPLDNHPCAGCAGEKTSSITWFHEACDQMPETWGINRVRIVWQESLT